MTWSSPAIVLRGADAERQRPRGVITSMQEGDHMRALAQAFIDQSLTYLTSEYLPKIRRCVESIGEDDVWWRPNSQSNSVGNLLLHLAGNVRQWVVSGIGGQPDVRERQKEFDAERGPGRRELLELLELTLHEVDEVLTHLDAERLLERRMIQGREVTLLEALYHAVEHFAMHTGQITYITKLRTSQDLKFYHVEADIPRPAW
jgi:uncharacterized damage-inducible protein DinB